MKKHYEPTEQENRIFRRTMVQAMVFVFLIMMSASAFGTALTLTLTKTDLSCYQNGDGKIIAQATGGTAPYQYALQKVGDYSTGFASQDTFTGLDAATYIITVADAGGHSAMSTIVVSEPALLTMADSGVNTTGGLNNGAIYSNAYGGVPPYIYRWNTGDSTQNITGLARGYYYSSVTDSRGCTAGLYNIHIDTGSNYLSAIINNVQVNQCYPDQRVQFNIDMLGGTRPYFISLDGGPYSEVYISSYNYYNQTGRYHTIKIKDATNTVYTLTDTIWQVAIAPLTIHTQVTQAAGGSNGSVILTATGGTPGYTFCCQQTNFAPGQYGVLVTDTVYCRAYSTIYIYDTLLNPPLTATANVGGPTDCGNNGGGYVTLTISGGRVPYQLKLDTNDYLSGYTAFYGLAGGDHIVYVKDALDSVLVLHVHIRADSLDFAGAVTNATAGLNNGSVTLNVTRGVAPFSFSWSDGTSNPYDSALAAVTYLDATITDSLGCSVTKSFVVDSGRLTATAVVTQPSACQTGYIQVIGAGGKHPYRDQYGNELAPDYYYYNLTPGANTFMVIDAQNDTVRVSANLGARPLPLSLSYTSTPSTGGNSNGTLTANVSGGTPPYHYRWNMTTVDTAYIGALAVGRYNVQVTDSNGCRDYFYNIQVFDNSGVPLTGSVLAYSNSACDTTDGSIEIDINGGTGPYIYSIGNGFDTSGYTNYGFDNTLPGLYPVTVVDAVGDTFRTLVYQVRTAPEPPLVVTATIINATGGLNNGSISLNVSGGYQPYSYYWQSSSTTTPVLSGQGPGQYSVNISDSVGCSFYSYFGIDTGSSVFSAAAYVNNSPCLGQASISIVNVSGGTQPYSYQINGGGYQSNVNRFEGLSAGVYVVNAKDAAGAVLTFRDTVTAQPDNITVTATVTNASTSTSADGAITLHATGGFGSYGYYWQNDNSYGATDSYLRAGLYYPQVEDSLGCYAYPVIQVGVGTVTFAATESVVNVNCHGDSTGAITVSATGANQPLVYQIGTSGYSSNNVFTGLAGGTYTITTKDATGATIVHQAVVKEPAAALSVTGVAANPNGGQPNGSITLTETGGTPPYITLWSDLIAPAVNRTNLSGGNYAVQVTDSLGCRAYTAFLLDTTVRATVSAVVNVACHGESTGSIQVLASGGSSAYTYKLGNGSYQSNSLFSNLAAGNYIITVRAGGNDTFVVHQTITEPATAIALSGAVTNTTSGQSNGAITLTVSGGVQPYTYDWGGGVTTENRTGLAVGSYTVALTDSAGCHRSASFTVVVTGINDVSGTASGISIYPNPNNGSFIIRSATSGEFVLINELGQKIKTINLVANTPCQFADQSIAEGVYYMVATDQRYSVRNKIVIVK